MKLSEAILLGDSLAKRQAGTWMNATGTAGCALGRAALAVGVRQPKSWVIEDLWPWIRKDRQMIKIIIMFDKEVCRGTKTIEELVDYVRSVEPAEKPEVAPMPSSKTKVMAG